MDTKQSITPADIQTELNHLWDAQVENEESKACLFNLIIYTHEERRTDYFKGITRLVADQFPCRIIFIQYHPEQSSSLNVYVSIETSRSEQGILCDQIILEAGKNDLEKIPFLILPLLIPDLPIYLFWGQDPSKENTILPRLQHLATRLVFDSESTEDLHKFSENMLGWLNSATSPLIDMNWARIGGWREVLAYTFDSPERFAQLMTAHLIKITYNSSPNLLFMRPETQAVYLQAWLASRLGWQFKAFEKQANTLILHYQQAKESAQIHLIPQENQKFDPEDLFEFEVLGSNDYSCHLQRLERDLIRAEVCNQFQCELPFTLYLPNLRTGKSFMQEIFFHKTSEQYVPMLQLICQIKWS